MKKKKDFTPSFPVNKDVEYIVKKTKDFEELFIKWRKKVFTIPVLTMIGVWIIVLYIIFS